MGSFCQESKWSINWLEISWEGSRPREMKGGSWIFWTVTFLSPQRSDKITFNRNHDHQTVGQNCGEMLAETGSFDVLFWYWVLGIGYSGIYIHIYVYIYIEYWVLGYIHICTHIYILRMEDEVILHGQSSWKNTWSRPMPNTKYAWWVWRYALIWWCMVGHHETT